MADTDRDKLVAQAEQQIAALGPLHDLAQEVRAYPLRLLRLIYKLHHERGAPVADHLLQLPPYLGDTALRGLVEGGYVSRREGTRYAIHAYEPTEAGSALVDGIDGVEAGGKLAKSGPGKRPGGRSRKSASGE